MSAATFDHRRAIIRSVRSQGERIGTRAECISQRVIEADRFVWCHASKRQLAFWFCVLAASAVVGCGRAPDAPVGDATPGIRRLTLAYVQYAAANRGVGPADRASLAKFLMQRNHLSKSDADACFVSPRDHQPYIVRWGQRPFGSAATATGPDPPKPKILVIEATAVDGTRYAGNGQLSVEQLPEDELANLVPKKIAKGN